MPVTSYGPWPTTEEQPQPPLVPRYFPDPSPGDAAAGAPTEQFAPVVDPVADPFGRLPWSGHPADTTPGATPLTPAEDPATAEYPVIAEGPATAEYPVIAEGPATAELPAVTDATEELAAPPPVFVDASGRRQRRMRRLGAVLAVPAGGYLMLLGSTLLGGPTVNAPFLPLPQPPAPSAPVQSPTPSDTPSDAPVTAAEAEAAPSTPRTTVPTRQGGTAPVQRPTTPGGAAPTEPGSDQPGAPTPAATPSAPPKTAPPAATPTPGHGRPTTAPGNSGNKPTKP